MTHVKRFFAVLSLAALCAALPVTSQAQPVPVEQQDEFVPVSELPPEERLPAAPLLVGAYAFVVLALFVYILSVSRRVAAVKDDIARLEADVKQGHRG